MDILRRNKYYATIALIIVWGALWGIFEITLGYLLHAISFGFSWLVWYPASCFFMINVYRATHSTWSVLFVGILSGSMKLLNLLLPGRIDRVINPAISIVFEAMTLALGIYIVNKYLSKQQNKVYWKALVVLSVNTGWRIMFCLYLLLLVPEWMREISVISSVEKIIPFLVTQNLMTSLIVFAGFLLKRQVFKPLRFIENCLSGSPVPLKWKPVVTITLLIFLLAVNVVLQLTLS